VTAYVPLWCKSNGSFLEGASHPEELVEQAHHLGLRALALTDRDGVYGVVRAHEKARELGVRLVVGAQVSVDDGSQIVLLAEDRAGYANLCGLLTAGRLRSPKGSSQVAWREVCERAPGLVARWGGDRSRLVEERDAAEVGGALREAFGDRLYALLARHQRAEEVQQEALLRARAARLGVPVVAGSEVLYHLAARRPLQDVLTCIRHGVTHHTAGRLIKPNAEHDLTTPHAYARLFKDDSAAVERTS
jgi:error-prone DNA polymerase